MCTFSLALLHHFQNFFLNFLSYILCSTYDFCSCSVIAVTVGLLYCAFVQHVIGHSEAILLFI